MNNTPPPVSLQEKNRVIAESIFASDFVKNTINHFKESGNDYALNEFFQLLDYHTSWNKLIPVCQKIISKESVIKVEKNGIQSVQPYIDACHKMKKGAICFDFEMTFDGVYDFIKWHNNLTSPTPPTY